MKKFAWRKLNNIPYTPEVLADVILATPNTVRKMITDEGLPTIGDGKNPYIISGAEAKKFIKKRNEKNKHPLKHPDEFFCFKCHKNYKADLSTITIKNNNKFGVCPNCGQKMRKYYQRP